MNLNKTLLTVSLLAVFHSSYGISVNDILIFFNKDKNQETTTSDPLFQLAGSENLSDNDAFTNLSKPGSKRILEPKTEREITLEKEYENDFRQEYLAALQDTSFHNFIANNVEELGSGIDNLQNVLAIFLPLQAAFKANGNKTIIEAGFESFKQVHHLLEQTQEQNEKAEKDFIRNNKKELECLQDLNERAAHHQALETSKTPNLRKWIIEEEQRKTERQRAMQEAYKQKEAKKAAEQSQFS